MVRAWAKANPRADLKKLEEAWPHKLIHKYGVWAVLKKAQERSKPRPRYFLKDVDRIKVGDKTICVCNQITKPIIDAIIKHATSIGVKVK